MSDYRKTYLSEYQRKRRREVKRVEIQLTQAEHKKLSLLSGKRNLAPYIKSSALAYSNDQYLVPDEEQLTMLVQQLRRIGTNVNQIARRTNRGNDGKAVELARQVGLLEKLLYHKLQNPEHLVTAVERHLRDNTPVAERLRRLLEGA